MPARKQPTKAELVNSYMKQNEYILERLTKIENSLEEKIDAKIIVHLKSQIHMMESMLDEIVCQKEVLIELGILTIKSHFLISSLFKPLLSLPKTRTPFLFLSFPAISLISIELLAIL